MKYSNSLTQLLKHNSAPLVFLLLQSYYHYEDIHTLRVHFYRSKILFQWIEGHNGAVVKSKAASSVKSWVWFQSPHLLFACSPRAHAFSGYLFPQWETTLKMHTGLKLVVWLCSYICPHNYWWGVYRPPLMETPPMWAVLVEGLR